MSLGKAFREDPGLGRRRRLLVSRQETDIFAQMPADLQGVEFSLLLSEGSTPDLGAPSHCNFLSSKIRLHLFSINLTFKKMPALVLLAEPVHRNAKHRLCQWLPWDVCGSEKGHWGNGGGSSAPEL